MGNENQKKNCEGYLDTTVYTAIKKADNDEEHRAFCKLLSTVLSVVDLAGFRVQGKLSFRSKKTGKVFTKD